MDLSCLFWRFDPISSEAPCNSLWAMVPETIKIDCKVLEKGATYPLNSVTFKHFNPAYGNVFSDRDCLCSVIKITKFDPGGIWWRQPPLPKSRKSPYYVIHYFKGPDLVRWEKINCQNNFVTLLFKLWLKSNLHPPPHTFLL